VFSPPSHALNTSSHQISEVILEAAGRDPRYLPLLPGLFTVPDNTPYTNIAENFYALFNAEAKYPADLRHCWTINSPVCSQLMNFVVFNPCLQLDAKGITPFLPYVIHGDLVGILNTGNKVTSKSEGVVSR
jgi:hypothetical protein